MTYLYVIHIPIAHKGGEYFMPRTAAIDISAHRRLLPPEVKLHLAAPLISPEEKEGFSEPFDAIPGIDIVPLRYENSFVEGLGSLIPNIFKLWKAVGSANITHTGCGGFPYFFSPSFLAHLVALFRQKSLLYVMDCDLVGKLEVDQVGRAKNIVKKWVWIVYAKLSWLLYTWCLKTASVTFLLGEGVVSRYGLYANKALKIYQPIIGRDSMISEKELAGKIEEIKNNKPLTLCFAGRLVPEKGVEVMIEALSILKKEDKDFFANFYGDGSQKKTYQDLVVKSGLEGSVAFHGQMEWGEELFSLMRQNHIQIVPHLTLEMTRNVFDGMASGCALVVSDTKALASLIDDSSAGVSFERGNAEALAGKLLDMDSNRDKTIDHIKNGLAFVLENDRDAHINRRLNYLFNEIPALAVEVEQ